MNTHIRTFHRFVMVLAAWLVCVSIYADTLVEKLHSLPSIQGVEVLQSNDQIEKLVCNITQQLDWKNKGVGVFQKRILFMNSVF